MSLALAFVIVVYNGLFGVVPMHTAKIDRQWIGLACDMIYTADFLLPLGEELEEIMLGLPRYIWTF